MTLEITRENWKAFFDDLSRDLAGCKTSVQILDNNLGAQFLSENLPFGGMTFEDKSGRRVIAVTVGNGPQNHQTHNIYNPNKIVFESDSGKPGGTLDIENENGAKTLITFTQPRFFTLKQ